MTACDMQALRRNRKGRGLTSRDGKVRRVGCAAPSSFHWMLLLVPLHLTPAVPGAAMDSNVESRNGTAGLVPAAERKDAVRKREDAAEEDPLRKRQADRVDRPDEWSKVLSGVELYGSARINYRFSDIDSFLGDGGSRIGASAQWRIQPKTWVFGRVEAGFNVLDTLDWVFKPGNRSENTTGDAFFSRLMYAGVETPDLIAAFGKNWSTYYQVSGFTDLFDSTGGSASGTFNAGTDGGPTGTGRADSTLQARFLFDWFSESSKIDPFHLNVQAQHGRLVPGVPGVDYGTAVGLSGIVKTVANAEVGLAYNFAEVPNRDRSDIRAAGISGNAHAILVGVRRFQDNWYLATTIARLNNHETTDQSRYFDGWGWEVYGRHRLFGKLWAVGGWNWLQPDSGEPQAMNYRIKYGVLGLRYALEGFRQLIYFEARLDDSRLEDGSRIGNSYVIGVRWDFP